MHLGFRHAVRFDKKFTRLVQQDVEVPKLPFRPLGPVKQLVAPSYLQLSCLTGALGPVLAERTEARIYLQRPFGRLIR